MTSNSLIRGTFPIGVTRSSEEISLMRSPTNTFKFCAKDAPKMIPLPFDDFLWIW